VLAAVAGIVAPNTRSQTPAADGKVISGSITDAWIDRPLKRITNISRGIDNSSSSFRAVNLWFNLQREEPAWRLIRNRKCCWPSAVISESAKTPASRSNAGVAVIALIPCFAATARLGRCGFPVGTVNFASRSSRPSVRRSQSRRKSYFLSIPKKDHNAVNKRLTRFEADSAFQARMGTVMVERRRRPRWLRTCSALRRRQWSSPPSCIPLPADSTARAFRIGLGSPCAPVNKQRSGNFRRSFFTL
jgi:hypothetical protein